MARPSEQTREIPALQLRAAFRPETANDEKRTIELVWTTGARVKRGFWEPFLEELSLNKKHVRMERLKSGRAPLLDNHRSYGSAASIPGVIESARLDGQEGVCVVRFAKAEDDEEAEKLYRKAKDGIVTNVSVGYIVHKYERVQEGEEQKGALPVYRAVDWEPYEVSFVPIGADAGAFARSAPELHTCTFVTRSPGEHMETETTPTAQQAAPTTAPAAAAPAPVTPAATDEATRAAEDATRRELQRGIAIRSAVRAAKLGESFANELIENRTSVDEARKLILDKLAAAADSVRTDNHQPITGGDTDKEKRMRGMTAGLLRRTGFAPIIEQAVKLGGPAAEQLRGVELDPGEFRGVTLLTACREFLELSGVRTARMSNGQLFEAAILQRSGGFQTTSDFAVLFENVMNKAVLAAYAIQPDTWRKFCGTDRVADFRDAHRFRTGSLDVLDALGEHGEFKNKAIPDGQKQSINTATKGNIYAISRQAFINDDLGALTDIFTKMGRAAARTIEEDVYALLNANAGLGPTQTDAQPFFHANRKNVGTAGALAVATIDSDRIVMLKQKDISNREYLDMRPAVLLVPVGLGSEARKINSMEYDGVSNKMQVPNTVRGLFREVVETPRLTDATRRYLFADPSLHPAIVVVFLEESGEAPVLSSKDGWRVEGVEYKVRIDAKAQMFEPKAAVTNAGT